MAKKRANGEGTIRLRSDGRWEMSVMIGFQDNGKPKRKSIYGKSQKEVREKHQDFIEKQNRGVSIDKRLKMDTWVDKWYEDYKGNVRPSTYEGYQYTVAHIKRKMGHYKIAEIKPIDIENAIKEYIAEGMSASYVSKIKGMLHQILRKAEANGLIDKNPVALTEKAKLPKGGTKDSFSLTEVGKLLTELPDTRIGHAIRLSIACGLRPQEMLGLSKEHVAEDFSTLYIRQAIHLIKGAVQIGDTKNTHSVRDIPVPKNVQVSLQYLYENARNFLLEGMNAMPLHPSTYRKYFESALKQVEEVRLLTPHCCRHTYMTLLSLTGTSLKTIQTLAGQFDEATTVRYMHMLDEESIRAVGALSDILANTANVHP